MREMAKRTTRLWSIQKQPNDVVSVLRIPGFPRKEKKRKESVRTRLVVVARFERKPIEKLLQVRLKKEH